MVENQMVKPQKVGKVRMSFSKIEEPIQMPDLLGSAEGFIPMVHGKRNSGGSRGCFP